MSMRPRMESVISACLIVLVIRSRRPFFKSKPGKYLVLATLVIVVVTLFLPISPLAGLLEFQLLPLSFLLMVGAILLIYIIAAELLKKGFYARVRL
jgi:Mg2+-importing ATPase